MKLRIKYKLNYLKNANYVSQCGHKVPAKA